MRVVRRRHAERAKERDVLGGVAQVVFAADDVGDAHLEVVDDVDEMEHRLAIRADDHEVGVGGFAVGWLASYIADDEIGDRDRLAGHPELHGAFVLVSQVAGEERFDAAVVILLSLALEVRAAIALARAGGVGRQRAFVPGQPQPAKAVEDHIDRFLHIARGVGVLDPQDEGAAGVPGVEPIEQRGARAADVKKAGGAGGETNAGFHIGREIDRSHRARAKSSPQRIRIGR